MLSRHQSRIKTVHPRERSHQGALVVVHRLEHLVDRICRHLVVSQHQVVVGHQVGCFVDAGAISAGLKLSRIGRRHVLAQPFHRRGRWINLNDLQPADLRRGLLHLARGQNEEEYVRSAGRKVVGATHHVGHQHLLYVVVGQSAIRKLGIH